MIVHVIRIIAIILSPNTHMFCHTALQTQTILSCPINLISVWISVAQPISLARPPPLPPSPEPHGVEKEGLELGV